MIERTLPSRQCRIFLAERVRGVPKLLNSRDAEGGPRPVRPIRGVESPFIGDRQPRFNLRARMVRCSQEVLGG